MSGDRMRADMAAQPEVLRRLAGRRGDILTALGSVAPVGVIVARGSSDYAAVFGRYLLEAVTGRPVALAAPSSDALRRRAAARRLAGSRHQPVRPHAGDHHRARALPVGGRTNRRADKRPLEPTRGRGDVDVALDTGDEEAGPATKTFTAELAAVAMIAEALGPVPWDARDWSASRGDRSSARRSAGRRGRDAGRCTRADCRRPRLSDVRGPRGGAEAARAAGAAEGWSAADFRHGPMTVARGDLPLLAVSASGPAEADVAKLAGELAEAGTPVLELAERATRNFPTARPPRTAVVYRRAFARSNSRWRSPSVAGWNPTTRPGCGRSPRRGSSAERA